MDNALLMSLGELLLGILVLVFSGDYLVKGATAIANHFKISSLVIGLTVVAFGTSAPELIVSLDAAITGHPEIALGNVIGSNIANIALVLGITVIILPMPVAQQTIKRSWPVMLIAGIALYLTMLNNRVGTFEGVALFVLLIWFIISSIRSSKRFPISISIPKPSNKLPIWVYIGIVVLASGGLALGSRFLVNGASVMAASMGVSERIISITIVAFGTSVPELTASVIAALKKETDISVGNIVGSNIFNVFAVIGISSGVHVIDFNFSEFAIDLNFMLLFFILLFVFILPWKEIGQGIKQKQGLVKIYKGITGSRISRTEGGILVVMYVVYIVLIFK
ncbi:MAG: calcium/sodium antiporter [Prolixibacteraceae bacterium]|nr:calcium/sodium antiporter [Prolixibacteraceae bacterium]MBN2650428.1 calcium/sodium antiporter [Prolixibacteraceae bacterium]